MTIKPLQLAGRIIMENGGETYRVEETVTRMGRAFGLKNVESFAVPSGVFVSCEKRTAPTKPPCCGCTAGEPTSVAWTR